jgi:hypothetical protein
VLVGVLVGGVNVPVGVFVGVLVGVRTTHPPMVVLPSPVTVTSFVAKARPTKVPLVKEMELPARMVPLKSESVIVAASAVHQYTLHARPPPDMITWKLVPVRAPVPPVPILKTQIPFEGPLSVNMTLVIVAPAVKQ